jgi:hypothetical protein
MAKTELYKMRPKSTLELHSSLSYEALNAIGLWALKSLIKVYCNLK